MSQIRNIFFFPLLVSKEAEWKWIKSASFHLEILFVTIENLGWLHLFEREVLYRTSTMFILVTFLYCNAAGRFGGEWHLQLQDNL